MIRESSCLSDVIKEQGCVRPLGQYDVLSRTADCPVRRYGRKFAFGSTVAGGKFVIRCRPNLRGILVCRRWFGDWNMAPIYFSLDSFYSFPPSQFLFLLFLFQTTHSLIFVAESARSLEGGPCFVDAYPPEQRHRDKLGRDD